MKTTSTRGKTTVKKKQVIIDPKDLLGKADSKVATEKYGRSWLDSGNKTITSYKELLHNVINNEDYEIEFIDEGLVHTCSMRELSMENSYLNDGDEYSRGLEMRLFSDILKRHITRENPRCAIANVVAGIYEEKILVKTGIFKKVFTYEGSEGVINVYMCKRSDLKK